MNYETATDFQLNMRLAELLDFELFEHQGAALKSKSSSVLICDRLVGSTEVNYCTDWRTTMLLGIEHGVSLINDDIGGHYSVMISDSDTTWCRKEDVLRAIVICLIKKLEQPH